MTAKIITDSGANCFAPVIGGIPHANVPLTIMVNGHAWLDNEQLDLANFLLALKNTKTPTSTACPSVGEWLKAFAGADEIFVLTITSALSGSYNAAVQAAELFMNDRPGVRIHVFDTKSAGPQIRLLASQLAVTINHGYSFDEIIEITNTQIHQTDLLFALTELNNLANNGRVSPAIAKLTRLLHLSIYGTTSTTGEFQMLGKMRGGKRLLPKLAQVMEKQGYVGGRVFIDHVNCRPQADQLASTIAQVFPGAIINVSACGALCSYYAENGGLMIGFEK
ncbi:DegV family protein [uncultured Limosilactobacillus sp.]|uniref:DegV family protein n=1 Tax=uncultured Limosilactobacillus sp. TaxID=2837629 RepID=UPI0025E6114E|nr:DegV family protein [uncultured Limosilactobacillus sp.]